MKTHSIFAATIVAAFMVLATIPAHADDADDAYFDIKQTYGAVPGFFYLFPREEVAAAWRAFKALQINPDLAVDPKTRELIGVAAAAHGPCRACVYFHAAAALANGASEAEVLEVMTITTATRRLDALLGSLEFSPEMFKKETDLVLWGDAGRAEKFAPSLNLLESMSRVKSSASE